MAKPTTRVKAGAAKSTATTARKNPPAVLAVEPAAPVIAPVAEASAPAQSDAAENPQTPTLWWQSGWTAKVQKNEDEEGWAVAMTMDGESEPSLLVPWTMGRDKKNPKPIDIGGMTSLLKSANEIMLRHQQQTHASLHKSTKVATPQGRVLVQLDIVPDENNPHAILSAIDPDGELLARMRVVANFKFDHDVASAWVKSGCPKIEMPEG
jgi:hypothetical protein